MADLAPGLSSEDSNENANSKSDLGDFLSELHLDFCAKDFASYIKVDVSSQVRHKSFQFSLSILNL